MKELNWDDKRTKRFAKQAEEKNLILVGDSEKWGYKYYQFKDCKHFKRIAVDKVRSGSFECKQCLEDKHQKEAKAAGLEFVEYVDIQGYGLYKCIKCHHLQEFQYTHVRDKQIECEMCRDEKLKAEAKIKNLELIRRANDWDSSLYRFIKCGHERQITHSQVRNSEVTCLICFEEKVNEDAEKAGLELVGKAKSKGRGVRRYRFKCCGNERDIELSHVRQLSFACNKCVDTFRDMPSKIYLLKLNIHNIEWLKLGYSKNIPARIKAYKLHEEVSVSIITTVEFQDGHKAYEVESSIHNKNIKNKMNPKETSLYMESGANECYPVEMKEILLKELANLGNK